MKLSLKPVNEQVIVVTGASSGIGLATAYEAAERGAKVVLVSRNEDDLKNIVGEIEKKGGQAIYAVADVADDAQVQKAAEIAIEKFGGFDTWINNAGVSVYGRLVDIPLDEKRRVFDTNFWGVIHGCKAAVKHLKDRGGAIINIGSETSVHPLPLQGIYSASKHAVKAYTDALRMELEKDELPISVTLIKPSAINTPFTAHAKSHMEREPELPPPLYAPEVVARAIVACAEKPIPSLFVGATGATLGILEQLFPRVAERLNEVIFFEKEKATTPKHRDEGLMQKPKREGRMYGDSPRRMRRTSFYTSAMIQRAATGLVAAGISSAVFKRVRALQRRKLVA